MIRKITIFIVLSSVVYFLIGLFTLSHYGMNWDEPVHYIRGQAFIRFLFTGKKDYSGVPRIYSHYAKFENSYIPQNIEYADDSVFRRSIYQFDSQGTNYLSFNEFVTNPGSHPPLNGELASIFNFIFYQKLGWLGDVESYHLFIIFVSTLLVFSIFLFAASEYGIFAGIISFLSLALYPLFFSESHFNIKDPVEAAFYGITIIVFYKGIIYHKKKLIFLSSLTAGLALGTKFNIFFVFPTLATWVIVLKWKKIIKLQLPFSKDITFSLCSLLVFPFLIFFISNPNLWGDPIKKFAYVFSFYREIGSIVYQPPNYVLFSFLNTYAFKWIFFSTPLIILFLSFFGFIYSLKTFSYEKNKTSLLVLMWFLIPIIRVSFFHTGIYGGIRQIIEFLPAMAIIAGIGASYVVKWLHGFIVKMKLFSYVPIQLLQLLVILSFLPITLKLISVHPNENVYFNPLIGGLKGAKEKNFIDWGVTLGSVYKQGINWVNQHAEKDANLALVNGYMSNIPRIWIRQDINFNEKYYSGSLKKGEYLMEVVDYSWGKFGEKQKTDYIDRLIPVYTVQVDGVTILSVWKNDSMHSKK